MISVATSRKRGATATASGRSPAETGQVGAQDDARDNAKTKATNTKAMQGARDRATQGAMRMDRRRTDKGATQSAPVTRSALFTTSAMTLLLPAFMATGAHAETFTIPLVTSVDGNIDLGGSDSVEVDAGPAIVIDSDNTVVNEGDIVVDAPLNAIGVLIQGGVTGSLSNAGDISVVSAEETDDPLGANKTGILVQGNEAFNGDITLESGSLLDVEGNNSTGIDLRAGLTGNIVSEGRIDVNGKDTTGIRVTGQVTGPITIENGILDVSGENAAGLVIQERVTGTVTNNSLITVRSVLEGFVDDETTEEDDNQPLARGGVLIGASLDQGFLNNGPQDDQTDVVAAQIDGRLSEQAVLISPEVSNGMAGNVVLGAVGEGDEAYGFVNRGQILANGIEDGDSTIGLRVSGAEINDIAYTTVIENGLRTTNTIRSTTVNADSTAVSVGSGAEIPIIVNTGTISGSSTGSDGAMARAILVEEGAKVFSVDNEGAITAISSGDNAQAVAIQDFSGTLTTIYNKNSITASVNLPEDDDGNIPSDRGREIAIDASASTTDVRVTNAGSIFGDINLGSGNDLLEIVAFFDPDADETGESDSSSDSDNDDSPSAFIIGTIDTGAGADRITIDEGGVFRGGITHGDGTLDLTVNDGSLILVSDDQIRVTNATLGAESSVTVLLDEETVNTTRLIASEEVTLTDGVDFNVQLEDFLGESAQVTLIDSATLNLQTNLGLDADELFFLYNSDISRDVNDESNLVLTLTLKTPEELGLNNNQTAAYSSVIDLLELDEDLATALGNISDEDEFLDAYNQLLPDTGLPSRAVAVLLTDQATQAVGARLTSLRRVNREDGGTAWFQVFGSVYMQDPVEEEFGFDGETYGVAGGFDLPLLGADAMGLTFVWAGSRIEEKDSFDDEFIVDSLQGGLYASWSFGNAFFDLQGLGGYNKYRSSRRIRIGTFDDTADADWDGYQYSGNARIGWDLELGKWRFTPQAGFDYLYLKENGFREVSASELALSVEERDLTSMRASAGLEIGRKIKRRDSFFVPSLRAGYRYELETDPLVSTAQFRNTGDSFDIVGAELPETGVTGGLGFTFENRGLILNAGYDVLLEEDYIRHSGGVTFRFLFTR